MFDALDVHPALDFTKTRRSLLIPHGTHHITLSRYDRARLRFQFGEYMLDHGGTVSTLAGCPLELSDHIPEGVLAAIGKDRRVLALIDFRGDHDMPDV